MRVVLDANVIVAAFAARGLCCDVFELCLQSHTTISSKEILQEARKALSKKIKLPEATIDRITELVELSSEMVAPVAVDDRACRDKSDLHVLGAAGAGRAEYIVTGDPDLLSLEKYEWTRIISPRQFWEAMSNAKDT